MKVGLSIKVKLFLAFFAVSMLVTYTLSYLMYEHLRVSNITHLQQELKTIASLAALQIDGDSLERLTSPEQEESSEYDTIKQSLSKIAAADRKIKFIYTLRKTDEQSVFAFIVDADSDPDTMAHIGQVYDGKIAPQMEQGFLGPAVDDDFVTDQWGVTLSGYAPILNVENQVVAVVGIDVEAARVAEEVSTLFGRLIPYLMAVTLLVIAISYLLAHHFTKRLNGINDAVDCLTSGNLDIQLAVCGQDEIDRLAHNINRLVVNLNTEREGMLLAVITALVNTLEAKDAYTHGHSSEVADLSVSIATALALSEEDIFRIKIAALLHDVGKIGIPDSVLNKTTALTTEEWSLLQEHPAIGARIIAGIPSLVEIAAIVHSHHERWNGCGYPAQLADENIPLASRIIAVADAFQAMTSDRPYRKGRTEDEAMAELVSCSGSQFDPIIVDAFVRGRKASQMIEIQ